MNPFSYLWDAVAARGTAAQDAAAAAKALMDSIPPLVEQFRETLEVVRELEARMEAAGVEAERLKRAIGALEP